MKARFLLITFVLLQALLLASCGAGGRVGALQSESQSVDLADVEAVSVKIDRLRPVLIGTLTLVIVLGLATFGLWVYQQLS